jgi:hypothetical protein
MVGSGRRSHSYTYYTPDLLEAEGALETNSVLASGGIPCIQGNARFMPQIFERIAAAEPFLVGSTEVPTVGLVASDASRDAYYKEKDQAFFAGVHGFFRHLTETQVPMNLLGDHQLAEGDWGSGRLGEYKLIILPNTTTLSPQVLLARRAAIYTGGKARSFHDGIAQAAVAIDTGNARGRLDALIFATRSAA